MSLVDSQLRNSISPGRDIKIQSFGKKKAAVEISLSQLELEEEGKKEVKGEAKAEEEQVYDKKIYEEEDEETYPEAEDEDEVFEMCGVCLKDKEHWSDECPYLVCIPNPTEVTLGEGYDMVCVECNVLGGHSDIAGTECEDFDGTPWMGRASRKYCGIRKCFDHRHPDCPKKYLQETQMSLSELSAAYWSLVAEKNLKQLDLEYHNLCNDFHVCLLADRGF